MRTCLVPGPCTLQRITEQTMGLTEAWQCVSDRLLYPCTLQGAILMFCVCTRAQMYASHLLYPCTPQGMMLLMMGTAEALPEAPAEKPVFMEDMTEQQLATAVRTHTRTHGTEL